MIFEPLNDSNKKGEFYGAMCHWHLRKDGQITIREIIVEQGCQGHGQGRAMIERLRIVPGATSLYANCPADLPANGFYERLGFELESQIPTRKGRPMNQWRLKL
jgi:ribosomal protein S18 acetylase RimI-like enzyme